MPFMFQVKMIRRVAVAPLEGALQHDIGVGRELARAAITVPNLFGVGRPVSSMTRSGPPRLSTTSAAIFSCAG